MSASHCPPYNGIYSSRIPPEGFKQLAIAYNYMSERGSAQQATGKKIALRGLWVGIFSDGRCEEREVTFKSVEGRCLALTTYSDDTLFEVLGFKASGHPENMRILWRDGIHTLEKIDVVSLKGCPREQGHWPPR